MKHWIDFYDSAHSIYVSSRHRDVHFRRIADHILSNVPDGNAVVLDYSCGEAMDAARIATNCGKLILVEPAPGVRQRLHQRFGAIANIRVEASEALDTLTPGSLDLITIISVSQYLAADDLDRTLMRFHHWLKPAGRLVIGDVVPPNVGIVTDALALLRFGLREGFFLAAVRGLVRTAFSGYRKLRATHDLARYSQAEMIERLEKAGFTARRAPHNTGHNPARMTFVAEPA